MSSSLTTWIPKENQIPNISGQLKELYKHKFENIHIDAILATDDNALDFLLMYRDSIFQEEIPVSFCGIVDYNDSRIRDYKNYTGVYEEYDVPGTINLILKNHPGTNQIVVINDNTSSARELLARINRAENLFWGKVEFSYLTNKSPEEVKTLLEKLPETAAVIWSIYLRMPDGAVLTSEESVNFVCTTSPRPVYCIWDVVGQGVVGGRVANPFYQGEASAQKIVRILNGENPDSMEVSGSPMVYKFDYNVLERFGLELDDLPEDKIVLNMPFSFWQEYKALIISVIVVIIVLTSLVILLIFMIRRSRLAEVKIRKISDDLRVTNEELELAKEKVEEHDRLKTAFLANLSHEIRTPMNGILGFSYLLKEEGMENKLHDSYIDAIAQSGERMLALIDDLVNISKIESGVQTLDLSEFSLNELMKTTFTFFTPEANKKNVELKLNCCLKNETCTISADKVKLGQILTNLIKNALKFTLKGYIEFGYKLEDRNLLFWVKDTGTGIPDEFQKIIFERFRQADDSPYKGEEGLGLGLAISKAFIDLMEGEIWLESTLGKGTTFHFRIPYLPAGKSKLKKDTTKRN